MYDLERVVVLFCAVWCTASAQVFNPGYFSTQLQQPDLRFSRQSQINTFNQGYGPAQGTFYNHGYSPAQGSFYDPRFNSPAQTLSVDPRFNIPSQAVSYDTRFNSPAQTLSFDSSLNSHAQGTFFDPRFYVSSAQRSPIGQTLIRPTPRPSIDQLFITSTTPRSPFINERFTRPTPRTTVGTTTFTPPTQRRPGDPVFMSTTPMSFVPDFVDPAQSGPYAPRLSGPEQNLPYRQRLNALSQGVYRVPNLNQQDPRSRDPNAIGPKDRRPFDYLYVGTGQRRPYDRRFYGATENLGYFNPNESLALQAIRSYASSTNFCDSFNPPKPDFSSLTSRTSEAQCEGFVFDRRVQIERILRERVCRPLSSSPFYSRTNQTGSGRSSLAAAAGLSQASRVSTGGGDVSIAAIGGPMAQVMEFPHMGAMAWRKPNGEWKFKCGCILISATFVLTAAHCTVSPTDPDLIDLIPKVIRFGTSNLNSASLASDVSIGTITPYPDYQAPSRDHDIAVMQLQRTVQFSDSIQPACLWNRYDISPLGNVGTVTGWGVVGGNELAADLREAQLNIIEVDECNRLLINFLSSDWDGITEYQICAGTSTGGVDTTEGDSGGPMQVKVDIDEDTMYYVVGVTSFGFGTGLPNVPGVYARVASYLRWIESIAFA